MKFYATFGYGHLLRDCYVTIEATDDYAARELMHEAYGRVWSFMYKEEEYERCIARYELTEVPFGTPNKRLAEYDD